MNPVMKAIVMLGLVYASLAAIAAEMEYDRIRKDVNVMTQILTSAFDNHESGHHRLDVDGNYLAEQGAVFTIRMPRLMRSFAINIGGGDGEDIIKVRTGDRIVSVPGIQEEIDEAMEELHVELEELEGLDVRLLGDPGMFTGYAYSIEDRVRIDRGTRAAMREASRKVRDIERRISENRLELIHEDDDEERQALEQEIEELTDERAEAENELREIQSQFEEERRKAEAKRAEIREKMLAARQAQLETLETTVMQSLCDYGSTLRNLPDKEHVSVVIEAGSDEAERHIYVFDKGDVTDCRSDAEGLKNKATQYMF